ncbi:MAG TPA: heme o synthase [Aggregatilineales bacterium]|nr:protoheme IX farnesyltransferase [Chloroflexota bacterium]HOA25260.1 heme o synthase [Aggregatilineales bacterium]HQA67660.1 heme o synthase [Aggregatilineales bacterium]HQE18309.1 heme o synthase [Aggregatilineales bacterium]
MGLDSQVVSATRDRLSLQELFRTIVSLFKLRIVMLLLAAALGGAFLGAQGVPSLRTLIGIIVTGTLAAGGASAINQYIERERDALMRRTQRRPLPAGEIQRPAAILWIAIGMIVLSVALTLPTNPLMALYLALGAAIYVGVYTLWLKPRSVLNIVIGGAAGSMAVMTGGAAVRAASDPGVIVLALLLFLWTPVHFWALALFYKDDYATASVPMLPVLETDERTAWWIFLHAASTGFAALVLAVHPALGWLYLLPTAAITGMMMVHSVRLLRQPDRPHAIKLFVTTNIFLLLVLIAIVAATSARQVLGF